jgi:hypothetical protein
MKGEHLTLRILAVLVAAASLTAVVAAIAHGAGPASPGQGRGPETYTIGLFGDMPPMCFYGQVALVHCDSHYFKVDKPISRPDGGVLANFTRVETFGARNTHWVTATIDPSEPNLFVFEPRIVTANAG